MEFKALTGFFLRCVVCALFNVFFSPLGIHNYFARMGVAIGIAAALQHILEVPSLVEAVEAFLCGEASIGKVRALLLGLSLGTLVGCMGHIQGSTPLQVLFSGTLHGFLHCYTPNKKMGRLVFGTMTQCTWLSGVMFPICTYNWAWALATSWLLIVGALLGMLIAHQMARMQRRQSVH